MRKTELLSPSRRIALQSRAPVRRTRDRINSNASAATVIYIIRNEQRGNKEPSAPTNAVTIQHAPTYTKKEVGGVCKNSL